MPKFIEFATPNQQTASRSADERTQIVKDHIAYLKQQAQLNNVIFAGSATDNTGGLIVYEVESKEAAQALIRNDPLTKANMMDIEIHPFQTLADH
ncbi:YciI family protein [Nicoliella lavandulae]|uniref:YciI family protein n=1 Tax=Nicoliella lavandulae TaxID=3082954 RepID=A0ABU8SKB0_9LACO